MVQDEESLSLIKDCLTKASSLQKVDFVELQPTLEDRSEITELQE
jgi:hypothetical protein